MTPPSPRVSHLSSLTMTQSKPQHLHALETLTIEYRKLELTIISAEDLNNVNFISKMEVYAVASIDGDPHTQRRTPTDRDGGRSPVWNSTLRFAVPNADFSCHVLHIALRCQHAPDDREVGELHITLKELLDSCSNSGSQFVSYQVCKPSSVKTKGVINLSYNFSDVLVAQCAGNPYPSYPAAAGPKDREAATSKANPADYLPPVGAVGYGQHYGPPRPPQAGYGYPPNPPSAYGAAPPPGYGYGYPPQAGFGYPPSAYGAAPPPGYGYGYPPQAGFGYQPSPYGAAPPPGYGYGYPPQAGFGYPPSAYGAPPPGYGYGYPPQAGFGYQPSPYGAAPPPGYGYGAPAGHANGGQLQKPNHHHDWLAVLPFLASIGELVAAALEISSD